jgi:hypothetical protein
VYVYSLRECIASIKELLVRASARWWFLVTALAAGGVLIWEHVLAEGQIADRLWLWIALAGTVLGVFDAFHRVRFARDAALRRPVEEHHREALLDQLAKFQQKVYSELPCRQDNWSAFTAHYPARGKEIERWNEAMLAKLLDHGEGPTSDARKCLVDDLTLDVQAREIKSARDCPVCQKNLGLPST